MLVRSVLYELGEATAAPERCGQLSSHAWRIENVGGQAQSYLVGCVDCWEGALEAAHLLRACVGLAAKVSSAEQVVVAILHCCQLVVLRRKLVCIVAKKCALTGEEIVAGIIAEGIEVGGIAAGFALAWKWFSIRLELVWGFNSGAYQRRTRLMRGNGPPCCVRCV